MTGTGQDTLDRLIAEAERQVRIARIRYSSLAADAPLRDKVEAARRLRTADLELAELRDLVAE